MNRVRVSPSISFSGQVSGFAQLRDDPLNSTLGDANPSSDVTSPNGMVLMDTDQHMGMVRQKGPRCRVPFRPVDLSSHGVTGALKKLGAYGSHTPIRFLIAHYHQNATQCTGPGCPGGRFRASQDSEDTDYRVGEGTSGRDDGSHLLQKWYSWFLNHDISCVRVAVKRRGGDPESVETWVSMK